MWDDRSSPMSLVVVIGCRSGVGVPRLALSDMILDDPGIWLFHCHVSDHMELGMVTRYQVLP